MQAELCPLGIQAPCLIGRCSQDPGANHRYRPQAQRTPERDGTRYVVAEVQVQGMTLHTGRPGVAEKHRGGGYRYHR